MTNEELDEARAKEAARIWREQGSGHPWPTTIAARLAREGWMPPKPRVDPDVLAYRKWMKEIYSVKPHTRLDDGIDAGKHDHSVAALAFLAGAQHGKEQITILAEKLNAIIDRVYINSLDNCVTEINTPEIIDARATLSKILVANNKGD